MPAQMRIDQAGLPLGAVGFARTDGLDTGALVTLTNVGGGVSTRFRLLWVPPEDLTAIPSLVSAGPTSWTFSPQAGCWGTYRIELIVDEGLPTESRQIRIFGVRLPSTGLLIPAANESADPNASRLNAGANVIARSENNEPFAPFGTGSAFGWWKALRDTITSVDASPGVVANNAIYIQTPANGGNDATGERGKATKPFATLSAALGVALDGDVLLVGIGTFVGPGDVAAIRPLLRNVSVIGAGRELTVITDPAGIAFDLSGAKWTRFWIASLTITSTQYTISANGVAYAAGDYLPIGSYPSAPYSSGLFVTDALLQGAGGGGIGGTTIYNVGLAVFDRVIDQTGVTGSLDVNLVGAFVARNSTLQNVAITRDYDNPKQPPAPAPGSAVLLQCEVEAILLKKQAALEAGDTRITSLAGDKLNVSAGPVVAPRILGTRSIFASLDLASVGAGNLPDTASNILLVFADCAFGIAAFAVAAPAANRQAVELIGCTFANASPSLSAGDGIDAEARSSTFFDCSVNVVTPGTGTVAVASFRLAPVPTAAPTVFAFPFTLPSALYAFVPYGDTLAEAPLAVTAQTATNVTVTPTVVLGGNVGGILMAV